jgi:aminotransferase
MRDYLNASATALKQGAIRAMFDRMAGRENLISLAIGEPDGTTHPDIVEAGCRALKQGYTKYTPNAGYLQLREAISAATLPELAYSLTEEIIVTLGAMEALSLLFNVIISPGDEVIIPEPSWVNYAAMICYPGGKPVNVGCRMENAFKVQVSDLEAAVTPRTKALLLTNPSNPTGAYMTRDNLKAVAEFAIRHDLLVISDEIYVKLIYDGSEPCSIAQLPGMRERTVVVNGFSKAFNMTGWRVGYAMGPAEIIRRMVLLQENVCSCPPAAVQMAALYALSRMDIPEEAAAVFQEKRDIVYEGLSKIRGFKCVKPQGAFYIFPDVSAICTDVTAFCYDLLDKEAVACVPGDAFGASGKGHIRISYANSKENLRAALERIDRYVEQYCR